MTTEATIYTTIGNVRGGCGHKHRSLRAAVKCASADNTACSRHGGYSDRAARRWDGEEWACLSEDEAEETWAYRQGA